MLSAQDSVLDQHIKVALRMVGHQILLRSGDRSSLVLPIEKIGGRYKLSFQSPFQFEPDDLVGLVDSVIGQTILAGNYIVEMEACETGLVVYSYEMGFSSKSDMVPCSNRVQPKACYTLFFTILHNGQPFSSSQNDPIALADSFKEETKNRRLLAYMVPTAMVVVVAGIFFRKKNPPVSPNPNPEMISIGAYSFDKRNMTLSSNGQSVELTGKEADLLVLLHGAANITLDRDAILNAVWGDDGDYTGRTLDVFISKLRKKLEADESLKIVNIRGVGYKLIVNGQ
jgi:hypothetical protein